MQFLINYKRTVLKTKKSVLKANFLHCIQDSSKSEISPIYYIILFDNCNKVSVLIYLLYIIK